MKKIFLAVLATFGISSFGLAQQNENGNFFTRDMEYQLKANFSIGGGAPLGMPREIRKINSYNPTLVLGLEADATKWVSDNKKWGIRVGIRTEGKGMKTEAVVKNYFTEVIQSDEKIQGYFTGTVETDIKNTYVTMPVSVVYKVSPRWKLYGGLYASLLVDKNFSGYVSNGHLRQDTPVGAKIVFNEGGKANYNFSDDLRLFQWGGRLGAEWHLNKHFILFPELNYGINGIFKSEFKSISFALHNIYLNLGFGYKF